MKRIRPFGDFRENIDDLPGSDIAPIETSSHPPKEFNEDVAMIFSQIIWNGCVKNQDVSRLCSLGIPAISIALALLDADKFIEKVNEWCNENNL